MFAVESPRRKRLEHVASPAKLDDLMARRLFVRGLRTATAALLTALLTAGCSSETPDAKGQLMLAVKTDMSIPKDIDRVGIRISSLGVLVHDYEYPVGPDPNLRIPATLAVVAGDDPSKPVHIQVWARQSGKIRVLRDIVTTVPANRIAMMPVPIQWLCDGSGQEQDTSILSTCGEGLTCLAGACVSNVVDSSLLPDYDPKQVFGGGKASGGGSCFDTLACFSEGAVVAVDTGTCSVASPTDASSVNVGLVMPPGDDGICGPEACIVPVDRDPDYGWQVDGDRLLLPSAVCAKLQDGSILGVAVTTACETKTGAVPVCGPWSSVGADAGTFDAGAPADAGLGDASADAPPDDGGPDAPQDAPDDTGDADASVVPCDPPTDPSFGAMCLTLEAENVSLVPGDPELDGNGRLMVLVLDSPGFDDFGPTGNVLADYTTVAATTEGAYSLPDLRFDYLPLHVYVLTVHYDNEGEFGVFPNIRRGGAWVGGIDTSLGFHHLSLEEIELPPGQGTHVHQKLGAMRRLNVEVQPNVTPSDDGQGRLVWTAYPMPTILDGTAWLGHGNPDSCVDVTAGPVRVEGVVLGPGPHFVVATLDDYNQLMGPYESLLPGTIPGSMVSGSQGAPGVWNVPVGDSVEMMPSDYVADLSILLQEVVPQSGLQPYACNAADGGVPDGGGSDAGVPDGGSSDSGAPDSGLPDGGAPDACTSGLSCSTGMQGECAFGTTDCATGQELCLPFNGPFPEICDLLDNDCDGVPDDGNPDGGGTCSTGQLGPCDEGVWQCQNGGLLCEQVVFPVPESENGLDDNCDGLPDNCPVPSGQGALQGGECVVVACDADYFDLDGDPGNGCESYCSPMAETCNGFDDDCNGIVDDVMDLATDCNAQMPGAANVDVWACVGGACWVDACTSGTFDANSSAADGCEAASCVPGPETCNGIDDDCNGIKDDNLTDAPVEPGCWSIPGSSCSHEGVTWDPPPPQQGGAGCTDAGTLLAPCQLGTMTCVAGQWSCEGSHPPAMEVCDGKDNDCNGLTDDGTLQDVGQTCGTDVGECQFGQTACSSGVLVCTGGVGPVLEVCDALDNDCDGTPDDLAGPTEYCGLSEGVCVSGTVVCTGGVPVCEGGVVPGSEVCDLLDNDCNGIADDGIVCP